jgi:O-antigen/teichoic acid export membrane protein
MRLRRGHLSSSSGVWNVLGVLTARAVSTVVMLLVARLAGPQQVGLLAFAMVMFGILTLVNDIGIGGFLILRPDLPERSRRVCFTALFLWSLALALLGLTAVPLVLAVAPDSGVLPLYLTLVASIPIQSASWYADPLLTGLGRSRDRFTLRITQALGSTIPTLILALLGWGALSLAIGQLIGAISVALGAFALQPRSFGFAWDTPVVRSALRSGRGFIAQGGLAFISQNADNFFVGRNLGSAPLGIYSLTYRTAELPYAGIAEPLSQAAIPQYVGPHGDPNALANHYYNTLGRIVGLASFFCLNFAFVGDRLLMLLLGNAWAGHRSLVAVLAVWGYLRVVQGSQGWMVNAQGKAGLAARITAWVLVAKLPLLYFASFHGLTFVGLVMILSAFVQYVATRHLARLDALSHRRTVVTLLPSLAAGVIAAGCNLTLQSSAKTLPEALACLLGWGAAFVTYAAVMAALVPNLRSAIGKLVSRRSSITMPGRDAHV